MDIKNKILELENNEKYIVIDSLTYSNRLFIYLGKINENESDVSDKFELFELKNDSGVSRVEKVKDEHLNSILNMIFTTQNL